MLSRHSNHSFIYCIEVSSTLTNRNEALRDQIRQAGFKKIPDIMIRDLYFIESSLAKGEIEEIAQKLIVDLVTESYQIRQVNSQDKVKNLKRIETIYRPGVTDNVANELKKAIQRLGYLDFSGVVTGKQYIFSVALEEGIAHQIARQLLVNKTIQLYSLGEIHPEFVHAEPATDKAEIIPISSLSGENLVTLSQERRLALNKQEMLVIQDYFKKEGREPTDAELETLAQTWSEHCVHKTFRADIDLEPEGKTIHGILKTYLRSATDKINAPWVRSAFVDNAGVIEFDDKVDISFKVETHNHPSAIEPFGGANTGVGGVVRDILGVSHRPIATTDILCFGPQNLPDEKLPEGVLHPRRIQAGVVGGVQDYGNKLGLPTVNGAVLYHPGYTSNPLVYCGCVGLGPIGSHPDTPKHGDRIIVLGGRTGRDGIRGATFSSQEMTTETSEVAGSAVQIGDPITEKGTIEVLELARDDRLYNAVTDCGAGGLSSAVGEMASTIGCKAYLENVPLKYAGLEPWEIWLSEAQERIVMAVPSENIPALQTYCDMYRVELSDIGEFCETGRTQVIFNNNSIVDLENEFLHNGIPLHHLIANTNPEPSDITRPAIPTEIGIPQTEQDMLLALLSHPNIASKEDIVRLYDHEVRGSTVVKPMAGKGQDGPSDAVVLKPANTDGLKGFSLANGVNPYLGEVDAYSMAVSVIDEAVRNAVVVGTDPSRIAILDNFCWGNPNYPEILGSLVQAAHGCYDASLHYGTPFISGKDSFFNEYVDENGQRRAIPGTLVISSIGIVQDIAKSVTMDLKQKGNLLYLIGDWQGALAGSHALLVSGGREKVDSGWQNSFFGAVTALAESPVLPQNAPVLYRQYHQAVEKGLVASGHDLSEGGLAVAAAEMALAGQTGLSLDISTIHEDPRLALFAETNGCLLVEVAVDNQALFEGTFSGCAILKIGQVTESDVKIFSSGKMVLNTPVGDLRKAFIGRAK